MPRPEQWDFTLLPLDPRGRLHLFSDTERVPDASQQSQHRASPLSGVHRPLRPLHLDGGDRTEMTRPDFESWRDRPFNPSWYGTVLLQDAAIAREY